MNEIRSVKFIGKLYNRDKNGITERRVFLQNLIEIN